MGFSFDKFAGGLAQGLPNGVNTALAIRRSLNEQQQMEFNARVQAAQLDRQNRTAAIQEQQLQLEQQQQNLQKFNALQNVLKIPNPGTRKAAITFLAPQLGFDLQNPAAKAFIDAVGQNDPEFLQTIHDAAGEAGLGGAQADLIGKLFQTDPAGAINLLADMSKQKSAEYMAAMKGEGNTKQQFRTLTKTSTDPSTGATTTEQYGMTFDPSTGTVGIPNVGGGGGGSADPWSIGGQGGGGGITNQAPLVTGSKMAPEAAKNIVKLNASIGPAEATLTNLNRMGDKADRAFGLVAGEVTAASAGAGGGLAGIAGRAISKGVTAATGIGGPEDVAIRDNVIRVSSELIKDLSGAQVSRFEEARVSQFTVQPDDNLATVKAKMRGLIDYAKERRDAIKGTGKRLATNEELAGALSAVQQGVPLDKVTAYMEQNGVSSFGVGDYVNQYHGGQ